MRVDVDRLYGARDLDELRAQYERIAEVYDHDLAGPDDYRSPLQAMPTSEPDVLVRVWAFRSA